MASKISDLTLSTLTADDVFPVARSGQNYKINFKEATNPSIFRPEEYGALKDGSTDDRVAIQAAIDACYTAGGGIVLLSEGNYRVQESSGIALLLKTGVRLQGSGMNCTTISTDNTVSTSAYCLLAPFGYNTATAPYTAHSLDVCDLTLAGTHHTSGTSSNLHNLLGICHVPSASVCKVGFNNTGAHFFEINSSKNIVIEDCAVVAEGNHGAAKIQIDAGGSCGQRSASADIITNISGSATRASGTQTLFTVTTTAGLVVGEPIVIVGANGSSAATYNAVAGYRVTEIVSGTTVAVNLAWPGNATTAGTLNQIIPVENILISRFQDKQATDTAFGSSANYAREFLELTHTTALGVYRNITVDSCRIVPCIFSDTITATKTVVGFDNGAYPLEFTNFNFTNNIFEDGGHTGLTVLISLHSPYDSVRPTARITGINVSNNTVRRCGMYNFLVVGDAPNETSVRTSITSGNTVAFQNVVVSNNKIEVPLLGSAATAARPSRIFRFGLIENATVTNNYVVFPDQAPSQLFGLSWTNSVSANYVFFFDNTKNLHCVGNSVIVRLTAGNANLNLQAFVFSVGAMEVSSIPGCHVWMNNQALGIGSIGSNLAHSFLEANVSGVQRANWASNQGNYFVRGLWTNNRGASGGTPAGDTWSTHYLNHNTAADGISGSTFTIANQDTFGRHDWIPSSENIIQTFNNAAVTVDPLTTKLLQTGTMSASRAVTLSYASVGRDTSVIDQSGTATGANTLVLTRVGSDTINGATTLTISGAYCGANLYNNRNTSWTRFV